MWGFDSLKDLLDVLLVPIVLGFLVPWVTRLWQDRQRDSEIKTELVSEISGLVMTTVMTAHLFSTSLKQQAQSSDGDKDALDRIYLKWRVDTCIIGSKLHAYFPDKKKEGKQIHKRWRRFSDRLSEYYEKTRDTSTKKTLDQLENDREDLFEEKARIIEDILASKITGFR